MVYDNNGNILKKKEYAFTLKESYLLEELTCTEKQYIYDGDKLLSYNGESCEYDSMGNPIVYRNKSATWQNGRQLVAFNGNTFSYDGFGNRTQKNSNTTYYDCNNNVMFEYANGREIDWYRDSTGVIGCGVASVDVSGTYWLRKDILGNVVAILTDGGIVVARYIYDAWGNHKVVDNTGNEITDTAHIGNINPYRYRGYYFDTETGLYYLKSRYYDPETGRFISIDDISFADPDTINGLNLYAYCCNNPVMHVDPTGQALSLTFSDLLSQIRSLKDNRFVKALSQLNSTVSFIVGALEIVTNGHDTFNNNDLSNSQKWISFIIDTIHTSGQTVGGYFLQYVPWVGKGLSFTVPILVEYIWSGELNILGFDINLGWYININGKSLKDSTKSWINAWFE